MTPVFDRRIAPLIDEGLEDARITFVAGARQVGKTTLVRSLTAPGGGHPMREISLDDKAARDAANADPAAFVAGLGGPTFIDEIHRAPDLLLELKRAVDADTVPGRFLVTGSANVLAGRKILDALPGRIDRFEMWPLARTEIEHGAVNLVDELMAGRASEITGAPVGVGAYAERIAEGGYPEARLRRPGRSRSRWFDGYLSGALARDLEALADIRRADDVADLLRLVATQSANLFKAEPIASKLGMDRKTVQSYVGLLRDMYLVAVLPGWRPGLGAREAKHPKAYITDTGLLCHLLGADARRVADQADVRGKAHETFAVIEILKLASWSETDVRAYHYQRDREDVDLVLEDRAGHVAAIEVKSASTVRERDWRWLVKLRDAQGDRFRAGAIVAAVEQTLPLADRIWAVPFRALWA
jgi:uncharacterized protein